ncbi:MAG: sigma-54-dependent Fis family transcriptional regulator [Nitrospirae bacterium]|nr:sigma-54-dependent Fis family transcriptional regulator [Nitrospirota bacterium]MBI3593806.1 sigma-54-dependent Fis family transcriptional regulator [Nitrospirota bacterium]
MNTRNLPSADRILVVDDEPNMRALFKKILAKEGYQVESASSGEEAVRRLETDPFDLVISDLKMGGMDGIQLLKKVKEKAPNTLVILLTAFGTVDTAVSAMKEGAFDYLTKPVNNDEVKLVVKKALEIYHLKLEVEQLREKVEVNKDFKDIIGQSPRMRSLFRMIKMVAYSNTTILINGESGTGKELIARAIHFNSPRRERPFVTVDCGALPETLLESELFGHVRGSFTGAISNKKGLFEEADGGTLLLDEIGDTTIAFQSKLLRVLQESEFKPVGSNKSVHVDVRVVAATNKDLREGVKKKTFREDLYYRLAVVPVLLPSLKERKEDIPLLVDHFIKKYCEHNALLPKLISPQVMKILMDYPWHGNVRELENVIERAVLISPGNEIRLEALFSERSAEDESIDPLQESTHFAIQILERERIAIAMKKANGNRTQAAKLLGISRATLYNKMRQHRTESEHLSTS